MVVGFALDDGAGTVELLGEDQANHLVGKGEAGEGELLVGTLIDGGGEAIGAANDKDQATGRLLLLLQPAGKLHAAQLKAVLVEQDDVIGGLQLSEDEVSFSRFLLFLSQVLGVLQFGYGDDVKRHVVADALCIVTNASCEMLVDGLADLKKNGLHIYDLTFNLPRGMEAFKVLVAAGHHATVDVLEPEVVGQGEGQSYYY